MDLSISIVNFNNKNLLKHCVKNILSIKTNLSYEIIITDNKSIDNSVETIKKEILTLDKKIKLIQAQENKGFGAGHNLGLKNAKAKYLLIINPDIVILNQALNQLYQFMEEHPKAGIVGPKLLYPDLSLQRSAHPWPKLLTPLYRRTPLGKTIWGLKELKRYDMLEYQYQKPKKIDWLFGACLMIRKTVWEKINGFDERYFLYCEDIDLCTKSWALKHSVWCFPQAKVIHYHKRLSANASWWKALFNKTTRIHLHSHWKYMKKWRHKK